MARRSRDTESAFVQPLTVRQRFTVQRNRGLAYKFALRYITTHRPMTRLVGTDADYVQEAMVALMKAARYYDPARGFAFSTYASHVIFNHLRRLHRQERLIRLPAYLPRLLAANGGVDPRTGRQPPEVIVEADGPHDAVHGDREGDTEPIPRLHEGSVPPALSPLDLADERLWLRGILRRLPKRERIVVRLRYGLDGEPLSLRQIAPRIGATYETVRGLQKRAVLHLRALLMEAS